MCGCGDDQPDCGQMVCVVMTSLTVQMVCVCGDDQPDCADGVYVCVCVW